MHRFWVFIAAVLSLHIGLDLYAGEMPQQIAMFSDESAWEWFNGQEDGIQLRTLLLILSPLFLSLLGVMAFMSTLVRLYKWGDRRRFWVAYGLASAFGALSVVFVGAVVNDVLDYPFFNRLSIIGAFILTPWVNHIFFKLLTLVLYLLFLLSDALPKDFKLVGIPLGWVGVPLHIFSSKMYKLLTSRDIEQRKHELPAE